VNWVLSLKHKSAVRLVTVGALLPPSAVKSVRDLIFWQYAKIISESAGAGMVARFGHYVVFKLSLWHRVFH
jgi:hypothetical protein